MMKDQFQLESSSEPMPERIANRVMGIWGKAKLSFSKYLNKTVNGLGSKNRKIVFVLFCLLTVTACLFQVAKGFFLTEEEMVVGLGERIRISPIIGNEKNEVEKSTVISPEEWKRIESFRAYMSDLDSSATGKRIHDSILQTRPGLMDSVAMLEEIYLQQNKKN